MRNKDFLAIGSALGAAFFWSFSFVWFKIAFIAYNPLTVVIFRLAISAVLITIIASIFKRLQKPTRKDLRLFILMAFFEPFIFAAIAYSIVLKNLVSRYNTLTIIAYQNIIGILFFLPIWLVVDFNTFLHTPYHPQAFRAIILLAVFSSTLAFVFFTQSIRQISTWNLKPETHNLQP